MAKKRINIMISDDHKEWCEKKSRKESKENKANVSGYIAVLIQKDKENERH